MVFPFLLFLLIQYGKLLEVQRVKSLKYHWKVSGHLSIVCRKGVRTGRFHGMFKDTFNVQIRPGF